MKKIAAFVLVLTLLNSKKISAQEAIVQVGEFGVGIGGGHYFGDLNTRARLNRTKIAATAFFRKNLGNYINSITNRNMLLCCQAGSKFCAIRLFRSI